MPIVARFLPRSWRSLGRRRRTNLALAALIVVLALAMVLRQGVVRADAAEGVVLTDTTSDPAQWGRRHPLAYREWRGGLEPRHSSVGAGELAADEDPRLARMWSGYAFPDESRPGRGHAQSLGTTDSLDRSPPPGACLECHASAYAELRRAGGGDLARGADSLAGADYDDLRERIRHPVGCVDCHEPNSMRLRVTRPAFIEALRQARAASGQRDYDVNRDASAREMRTFVCAQCHAEYYLAGHRERLALPWARGLKADSMLAFYDSIGYMDWVHPTTLALVLKAQHPAYELYAQGAHARSGVTCADCHMPHRSVRGREVTDHRGRDPLLDVDHACRPCHDASPKALQDRVADIQATTLELRTTALDALLALIGDLDGARATDSTGIMPRAAREYQRRAQFLLDFVESERSLGFHAPQESARLLAGSINFSRLGQSVLRGGGRPPVMDGSPSRPRRRVEVKGGSGIKRASLWQHGADVRQ